MTISTSNISTSVPVAVLPNDQQFVGQGNVCCATRHHIDVQIDGQDITLGKWHPLYFVDTLSEFQWDKDTTDRRDFSNWIITTDLVKTQRITDRSTIQVGDIIMRASRVNGGSALTAPCYGVLILVTNVDTRQDSGGIDIRGHELRVDGLNLVPQQEHSSYFWLAPEDILYRIPDLTQYESEPAETEPSEVDVLRATIEDLETQVATYRQRRDFARQQHEVDIETIGRRLIEEADRRGWCSDYDDIVSALNSSLYVSLPTREKDWAFSVSMSDSVDVIVQSNGLRALCTVDFTIDVTVTRTVQGSPSDYDVEVEPEEVNSWDIGISDTEDFSVDDYEQLRSYILDEIDFNSASWNVDNYEEA